MGWFPDRRIATEELQGADRAAYGRKIVSELSKQLTEKYGESFDRTNLYRFLTFFKLFPDIFRVTANESKALRIVDAVRQQSLEQDSQTVDALRQQSQERSYEIVHTVCGQLKKVPEKNLDAVRLNSFDPYAALVATDWRQATPRLSWTHYRILLQVSDPEARAWYEHEAATEMWGSRTLQRNVSSQYYHRLLASQRKELVRDEMLRLTAPLESHDPTEFIKSPVIGEYLGFKADSTFRESDLEQAIIDNLERFMLELGKGFAFVARQQHIHTEKEDYYIDLVFYNYILKCFVLIDLKTSKVTHQDVGQMDMYVRMYDELRRTPGDSPTIGLLLCDDTDDDIARYSVLHDNDQLYAARYMLYMPTAEQLRNEIERQKQLFLMQQGEKG